MSKKILYIYFLIQHFMYKIFKKFIHIMVVLSEMCINVDYDFIHEFLFCKKYV